MGVEEDEEEEEGPYKIHTIPDIEDVHTLPSGSGRRSGGGSIQDPYHTIPYQKSRMSILSQVEVDEEVEEGPYKIHTIPYHTRNRGCPYSPKWKWTKKWRRVHTRSIPYHTIPEIEDVHTLPSGSGRRSGGGSIQDPYHTIPY